MKLEIEFTKHLYSKESSGLFVDYWVARALGCGASGATVFEAVEMLMDVMKGSDKIYQSYNNSELGPAILESKNQLEAFRRGSYEL